MKSWHSSYLLDLQISILSTQPTYFASCQLKPPSFFHVDMFPLTANFSFSNRVVSYPKSAPSRKLLVFKLFSYIYFSTFDINTTVSTVLPFSHKSRRISRPLRYIGKLNSIDLKGISDSPLGYI